MGNRGLTEESGILSVLDMIDEEVEGLSARIRVEPLETMEVSVRTRAIEVGFGANGCIVSIRVSGIRAA